MTFVEPDGNGKAEIEKPRLFPAGGKTIGGGVWFGKPDPEREFIVAEGIESTSAHAHIQRHGGMRGLVGGRRPQLVRPPEARLVRIFPDHDECGQSLAAARDAPRGMACGGAHCRGDDVAQWSATMPTTFGSPGL